MWSGWSRPWKKACERGLRRSKWIASSTTAATRSGNRIPASAAITAPSLCPQSTARSRPRASRKSIVSSAPRRCSGIAKRSTGVDWP